MRLGSRGSALALAQAELVAALLPGSEIVPISTAGDRDKATARFDQIGDGRGVFTREIERALLDGRIDAAVHSAKDLTGDMPPRPRDRRRCPSAHDPRDACCGPYASLHEIPAGTRVGTSSARRAGLLRRASARSADRAAARQRRYAAAQAGRRRGRRDHPRRRRAHAPGPRGAHRVPVRPAHVHPRGRAGGARGAGARRRRSAGGRHRPRSEPPAARRGARAAVAALGGGCTVPVAAYAWLDDAGELQVQTWSAP